MLYPLKFLPLYKNKVWGGNKIKTFGFDYSPLPNCGELWALSAVSDNESIVADGPLADNTLNDLLEIFMGELIGERNYERFGNEFPLLIKLIDAADKLSIQVHPDDDLARERGMDNGKTEMWYIIDADKDSTIVDGFNKPITREQYCELLAQQRLEEVLHIDTPQPGDVFFIPGGRVHAIGKGVLLAEIQQSSDCTYRIYDYNRPDTNGKLRQLHTEEALDAIEFEPIADGRTPYTYTPNTTSTIVDSQYFTTNLIHVDKPIRKDYTSLDSFVIYLCVEGIAAIKAMDTITPLHVGECVLLPAVATIAEIFADGKAKLLEIYIDPEKAPADECYHQYDSDWVAQFINGQGYNEEYHDDDECDCGCHHHHHDDDECDCGCHHHHHDDDDECDCGCHHHHE